MNTNEIDNINKIITNCNLLSKNNYILSQKHISNILNTIFRESVLLNNLILNVRNNGYKFKDELYNCSAEKHSNNKCFVMPEKPLFIFAFTTFLLQNIYNKDLNFLEFLKKNFFADTVAEQFKMFVNIVITPYIEVMNGIIERLDSESELFTYLYEEENNFEEEEEEEEEEKIEPPQFENFTIEVESPTLEKEAVTNISRIANELSIVLRRDDIKIKNNVKNEINFFLNSLIYICNNYTDMKLVDSAIKALSLSTKKIKKIKPWIDGINDALLIYFNTVN